MSRRTRPAPGVPVLSFVFAVLAGASVQAQTFQMPAHFEAVALPWTFDQPVGLAYAADGTAFVLQKAGVVRVLRPDGQLQGPPFIDLTAEVNNDHDRGLLSVAPQPGFTPDGGSQSWVYLLYTVSPVPGQDLGFNQDNQYSFSRLTRYRAVTQGGSIVADPASRHVLLGNALPDGSVPDCIASLHDSHSNGTLRFASDGTLLLTTGDGAHYDFQDNGGSDNAGFDTFVHPQTGLKGPTPKLQDEGAYRSQDLRSLSGKVLRLDPATGDGVASNPFYDGNPQSHRSRVWALGLRNPFRMTLFPGTGMSDPALGQPGAVLIGDIGWNTWEELNVSRIGGENFGWPCFEGFAGTNGYSTYGSPDPTKVTCTTPKTGTATSPVLAWNHGNAALLQPPGIYFDKNGNPAAGFKGGCSIGGDFYVGGAAGGSYPPAYDGRLFFCEYNQHTMFTATFDAAQHLTRVQLFATDTGSVVCVTRNPKDGDLYLCSLTGNRVLHLRYANDLSPVAKAKATPPYGPSPLQVAFSDDGSYDPDGDPLAFDWDFGDGSPHGSGASVQHVYATDGLYAVRLTASDLAGNAGVFDLQVAAGNAPPAAVILAPQTGSTYQTPATLLLAGSGSDPEGGALAYRWTVDLYHGTHVHPASFVAQGPTASFPIQTSPEDPELLYYRIELAVTDPGGLEGKAHVFVLPQERVVDVTGNARPIAKVFELSPPNPTGTGSKDVEIIRDGKYNAPGSSVASLQFDTSHSGGQGNDDWIGYELAAPPAPEFRFTHLRFQEGVTSFFGGWFEDLRVEGRRDGTWTPASNLTIAPAYPFGDDGHPADVYDLRFDPIEADAIRIRGNPGGLVGYVSCGELRAEGIAAAVETDLRDITAQGTVIGAVFSLSPPNPTGTTGSNDPETIRNGTYPPIGSASAIGNFDTSHNGDQGAFDWIGYDFGASRTFASVVFQEGRDQAIGGAFNALAVEVQSVAGGAWTPVANLLVTPAYAGMNLVGYETYRLDFAPVVARAIRVSGPTAGSQHFVSVGELRVFEPAPPLGAGWFPYGVGLGGSNVISLASPTPLALGLPVVLELSGAPASAPGLLLLSANASAFPAFGGTFLLDPTAMLGFAIAYDATGKRSIATNAPSDASLAGTAIFLQALAAPSPSPAAVKLSNGLKGVLDAW